MARRRKVPKSVETTVLTQSRRRCCLCFGLNKDAAIKNGQIVHVDQDRANNAIANLAWLCLPHHDDYDSRASQSKGITPEELKAYRDELYRAVAENRLPRKEAEAPKIIPSFNNVHMTTGHDSPIINAKGDVSFVVRRGAGKITVAPPVEAIGSNTEMRAYVEYLTKRYIEWRKKAINQGIDKRKFFPGKIHQLVEKHFGARTNLVPQDRFPELVDFLQKAIDNTIWGRKKRARNYHSFDEHCIQIRRKSTPTPPGTTRPGGRAERRDSLLRQLSECIEQGESIRAKIRIERGQLRERWVIGRDQDRYYQEPDREIVDADPFVEWKTTCATLLGEIIPTAHPIHGGLPCQFNGLPCGAGELRWAIAKLKAIKAVLQQGSLVV